MTIASPAEALWNQRHELAAMAPGLRHLIQAVDRPIDFSPGQWAQAAAFGLDFAPDLIIELGRNTGNSTACFLEVADRLSTKKTCRLLSLCLTNVWAEQTLPRLQRVRPAEWFARGDCEVCDILTYDFARSLEGVESCVILWDAHGFAVAEHILGRLLPALQARRHAVLIHDMCDLRYFNPSHAYGSEGLWKGEDTPGSALWLGNIFSPEREVVSLVDFTSRNRIPLHSADESFHTEIGAHPAKLQEMKHLLGEDLFALNGMWFWFSLNQGTGPFAFPPVQTAPPLPIPQSPIAQTLRRGKNLLRMGFKRGVKLLAGASN